MFQAARHGMCRDIVGGLTPGQSVHRGDSVSLWFGADYAREKLGIIHFRRAARTGPNQHRIRSGIADKGPYYYGLFSLCALMVGR
jgi:hypothetical protein